MAVLIRLPSKQCGPKMGGTLDYLKRNYKAVSLRRDGSRGSEVRLLTV